MDREGVALSLPPAARDSPIVIVGAGAAGLATAIFTRQLNPTTPVLLLDGAARPGAKILVSGGGRCNVTNSVVTEQDYWGGKRTVIRRVLRGLSVSETVAFFDRIGVTLKEEPGGKLFPISDRSRDVLDALMRAISEAGVTLSAGTRVNSITSAPPWRLETSRGELTAGALVLATGGLSLPKTGSDGGGLAIARAIGHTIVPTTPALAPLVLSDGFHQRVSGVSHDSELTIWIDGRAAERLGGSLLWTHFGISGPVALNASRHFLRAELEGRNTRMTAALVSGSFEVVDAQWMAVASGRPRLTLHRAVAEELPGSLAEALLDYLGLDGAMLLAHLPRSERRRLTHALVGLPLNVTGSRGYNYAEATAGGVNLDEIDPSSMASRRCPRLFLVGEMLDVDGRIGGFNFQWAWSSGRVAAEGLTRLGL